MNFQRILLLYASQRYLSAVILRYNIFFKGIFMLKEFKAFILRGNVLDLAVGVIIGAAFTAIVKSLVDNLINPLIGLFVRNSALNQLSFKLMGAKFTYGAFLNDVLNFLITAFVVFLLVKSINRLFPKKPVDETVVASEELTTLQEIRDLLAKQN